MPFIIDNQEAKDKYAFVDAILKASDYYHVLDVERTATTDDIRRAYIKKSRVCHPDKFVPAYPKATKSFQLLSTAYETLIDPSSRMLYDLTKQKGLPTLDPLHSTQTLHRVLHQLFHEFMEGDYLTFRSFIKTLNQTNPNFTITEEAIVQIELVFGRMKDLFQSTHPYYEAIQFELMQLYELQYEIRQLSYFSFWKRMELTLTLCRVLIGLPILIQIRSKQDTKQGLFHDHLESVLRMAIGLLEAGERWIKKD
ncbi:hypothetical protein BY458DRAFT_512601 [Sporodiniella umbellata]|nr:hypothetical protein BY458DRAFT_512601 [Sporodiniella umbellata]